jgi:phosphoribosylcarboxyaminoimidazole (NCAIR) mutase
MGGRRVESIYGFVPLPPGIPVGVVVSSYAGNMALTVTAEPYAIPDADRFMGWVLEEYLSLLNKAKQVAAKNDDRNNSEHGK